MKQILLYIWYFILAFLINFALFFLIGYALSLFKLAMDSPYIFIIVTALCGMFYAYLSVGAVYKNESQSNLQTKKSKKFIISFIFFLFYNVVFITIFLTLFTFKGTI